MGTGVPSSLLSPVHLRIQAASFDRAYPTTTAKPCQVFSRDSPELRKILRCAQNDRFLACHSERSEESLCHCIHSHDSPDCTHFWQITDFLPVLDLCKMHKQYTTTFG